MRKVSLALAVLLGAGCALPVASLAQGAPITDAYRQLRLLSSATQAGVSYSSFGEEWRKALGLINIAIEDSKPSNLTQKLERIKVAYSDISIFWGCRFTTTYVSICVNHVLDSGFQERNPSVMQVLREQLQRSEYTKMDQVTSAVVPVMFGKASEQVRELGVLLKKK